MPDGKITEIAKNKKAYHDYEILEKYEAGIALSGTEIKSVRQHNVNLKDSHVMARDGQAIVHNLHISPYNFGNVFNHEAKRPRRLLLHKDQILKLSQKSAEKGYSIIPLRMYIKGRYAKLEIGLAKGKRVHDKRDAIRERDIRREMDREMKDYR